ncbi:MAG: hypothetical protein J5787_02645 [Alphaproteobacteria bacterium]|nr:hypothetical protein [Alphaproteobacteria bacterium]
MIVPDKKTEAYLNKPVSLWELVCLCRSGILRPVDFLRAAALCRLNAEEKRKGKRLLFLLSCLSFLSAAFFFVVSEWSFFYTISGAVLLALLFVACSFFRRFAAADYAGAFLIGAMILLPDLIFGTNAILYEQLFLWFFLLVFWAVASQRSGVRLLPLIALNAAIIFYGIQFVLPSFQMDADTFCVLGALLNLLLLVAREATLGKTKIFDDSAFRFFPLLSVCLFLLTGTAVQTLSGGGISFLYCFIFTVSAGFYFVFKVFDWQACRLILVFCVLWITALLYRCVGMLSLSVEQSMALFLSTESLLIIAAVIGERSFSFRLEEK